MSSRAEPYPTARRKSADSSTARAVPDGTDASGRPPVDDAAALAALGIDLDEVRRQIEEAFGPGALITTPRHHVDVIVTEYGVAELEGLTVRERGQALAAIAHPRFRDELLAATDGAKVEHD